ncbi:glycolate oxidase iron-sulfur subunit [Sulfuritortus calidifontis]|uniref:Glycolate oxidase iron-sulfur subunit n=1 Tax=Sulfuritortus calidifontis TaxID=1914471 RepID=A0A4V2UQP0_9PROT|nr:glycolate oxidase subunit GlcF [Sulfuritortus calidifontis]TCS71698.1 glycolate oxidase iron-sulfur subunit [Sulfuritortus calidifontis]
METHLAPEFAGSRAGQEAEAILRACVHCGFCTATCPTYQLLGDELDGPRGRIYLIKQVFEGALPSRITQQHLDRCLTCRACETTCPSGVHYSRLADIGRAVLESKVARPLHERLLRWGLRKVVAEPARFGFVLGLARGIGFLLPAAMRRKLPQPRPAGTWPNLQSQRRVLVLEGCAQSVATPLTNAAAARVFAKLGIQLVRAEGAGCCGALAHHLSAEAEALAYMRRNIDAWWPHIEQGAEAILITASGCGVQVKDYGALLRHDPAYAEKAARVSELARDPVELLAGLDLAPLGRPGGGRRVAFHTPCTLNHGQKLNGRVEAMLSQLGYVPTPVRDGHLCCGSAGSYSVLQPELSTRLRDAKLAALTGGAPELIATANVGCQLHLEAGADRPVLHWLELLDRPAID